MNHIYCFIYSFLRKTPSRDMAYEMAAMFVALMVVMHVLALLMIIGFFTRDTGILSGNAKTVMVLAIILLFAASLFYYVGKRNGARVVKEFGERIDSGSSALIGGAIFVETLCLPLGIAGFVVFRF
jgi:uncharacterized RDD family membrane protein YckC